VTLAPLFADIESNRALILVAAITALAALLTAPLSLVIQGRQHRRDQRDNWQHQAELEARAITRQNEILGQVAQNTDKLHALSIQTGEIHEQGNGMFIAQLHATLDSERRTLALLHGLMTLYQEAGQPVPKTIIDNLPMTEQRISDVLTALEARERGGA
jgi:uncharacterized membrane protein